jgi:hypothetical protein
MEKIQHDFVNLLSIFFEKISEITKLDMKKIFPTLVGSSILAASMLAASAPAKAGTFACPTNIADNVTGTSGCQISDSKNQDDEKAVTVNADKFFGFDNWVFTGKTEYKDNEGQSGTWNISNLFPNSWDDIMLVFKSGNNTTLVGYLLQDGVTSGTWASPFEKSIFNVPNTRDVSHISVYYRVGQPTPPQSVPEPGSLVALSLIGGAMVLSRRHHVSKTA